MRIGQASGSQRLCDLSQPVFQRRRRAGVEGGHGADHTGLALLDHQPGVADDKQRRANNGQRQMREGVGKSGDEKAPDRFTAIYRQKEAAAQVFTAQAAIVSIAEVAELKTNRAPTYSRCPRL